MSNQMIAPSTRTPSLTDEGSTLDERELVNDKHSRLNPTIVKKRMSPNSVSQLVDGLKTAHTNGDHISVAGGRHAMGGQQFLQSGVLLDMTGMKNILNFDLDAGLVEVEAGCLWSDLIPALQDLQKGRKLQWAIAQKQTGCDRLSIGGALSANAHGRGLSMPPIVSDVEQFSMVMQDGQTVACSRSKNPDLFRLAIGGYGLFGVITSVTLRLLPRTVLQRSVELCESQNAVHTLEKRSSDGAIYGDFQFQVDHRSPGFLKTGILSTYAPICNPHEFWNDKAVTENKLLSPDDWRDLLYLAHTDKSTAFAEYSRHYQSTNGQLYSSDTFQLATYIDNYHEQLDERTHDQVGGTELITELYVPRKSLSLLLSDAADLLREENASVIYGTVRLIEKDEETFLPWAKERWACTVLNLHINHLPHDIAMASRTFCHLIDLAIKYGGTYYLTYHRFASRTQLLACYPQMPLFLKLKAKHDPDGLFRSEWFEHSKKLLGEE